MFLILAALLITAPAEARNRSLPGKSAIISTADILRRIQESSMVTIKTKYSQMKDNYSPHFLDNQAHIQGISFDCKTSDTGNPNDFAATIQVENRTSALPLGFIQTDTVISHSDCQSNPLFTERLRVRAQSADPVTIQQTVNFDRKWDLQENEFFREYSLEDAKGEILFSVKSQYVNNEGYDRIFTSVDIAGFRFLELNQTDLANERNIYVTTFGGQSKYFSVSIGSGEPSKIYKVHWSQTQLLYYDGETVISKVDFDNAIQNLPIRFSVFDLQTEFSLFMAKMPPTREANGGVVDTPFMRELQKNYERLLTNTDLESVKEFLRRTITEINSKKLKVEQQ